MADTILEMQNIYKSFGGVKALKNVRFSCCQGEVHVLAGENGAGKSTILKILAGIYAADSGKMFFRGKEAHFANPQQSLKSGIAMVFQELTLIPNMTILDNIFLNKEYKTRFGGVDYKKMREKLNSIMQKYGIRLNADSFVKTLSVAQQQMAEILKILVTEPDLIVLDEPTSALAQKEVGQLFEIVRTLKENGKTIIFISHRLEEVFEIGDRVTIFKDGEYITTKQINELNTDELIRLMVGRPIDAVFPPKCDSVGDETVFSVEHLSSGDALRDISFEVHKGEIVGVAGLQGHGQTEMFNAICGLFPIQSGQISINGRSKRIKNANQAIADGISLVPSDRKFEGLLLSQPIRHNLVLTSLDKRKKACFIDFKKEKEFSKESVGKLNIKVHSVDDEVRSLSGGNQQKVVLGKAIATNPDVILFNEPTRGIDVDAKREFYFIMRNYAQNGVAVVMCSSDMTEIIGMCDRVIVMYEGAISGVASGSDITEENIMRYSVGITT